MKHRFTTSLVTLALCCASNALAQGGVDEGAGNDEVVTPEEDEGSVGSRAPAAPPGAAPSPEPQAGERSRTAAPSNERWWESYRPMPENNLRVPLVATGGGLTGLGLFAIIAGGITWLSAYGHSRDLDDDCPNHICVEGTEGGDTYEATRDLSRAAAITVGVGFPVMITGVVLMGLGASAGQRTGSLSMAPIVTAHEKGAAMEVRF